MTIAKRICGFFVIVMTLLFSVNLPETWALKLTAHSAILMDMTTGQILYSHNEDRAIQPASITKILSLYLVDEAIREGRVRAGDPVKVSRQAGRTGGSKMYLQVGTEIPLEELLKGMAVVSANDASVAVAECIDGNVDLFVERMNRKAKELGMSRSYFRNPNGLPAKGQVTTARDVLILAYEYLRSFPEIAQRPFPAILHVPGNHSARPECPPEALPQCGRPQNRLGPKSGIPHHRHGKTRQHTPDSRRAMGAKNPNIRTRETEQLLDEGFRLVGVGQQKG